MMSSASEYISFPLFISSIILILFLIKKKNKKVLLELLPPGPKRLPIIGNFHQLGNLPHRSLQRLSKTYGDLMFMQLGSVPTLIASSPDAAREIMKTHDLVFSSRPPLYSVKKLTYDFHDITFAPYGDYWREVRKITVLELLTVKRVRSFEEVRVQEVARMTDDIIAEAATDPVDLSSLAFSLANNVVSRVTFGGISDRDRINFREILLETQHLIGEFNIADYFPGLAWINKYNGLDKRLDKTFQALDRFLDDIIRHHCDPERPKSDYEDIIDVLLRLQKDPDQTFTMTREQVKGLLLDIFVAGTDTSAATIVWTMCELIRNPQVMERAQQEVRQVAKGKTKVEEIDLPKLTYLKLVLKESLRLHPAAPLLVPRESTDKCTIANKYEIPAKTRVFINIAAVGTDPRYWENPYKFHPERFFDSQVDFKGLHFELLPFGAGRRGCPGINFAVQLVELAMANLLFRFNWELPKGMTVNDLGMEEVMGLTVHKKSPLCLVASPVDH